MGRPLSSSEHADAARRLLKDARTASEMRLAQSLLLPLELGLTIEQTARAIGRSIGSTSVMRSSFEKKASRLASSLHLTARRPLADQAAAGRPFAEHPLQHQGRSNDLGPREAGGLIEENAR